MKQKARTRRPLPKFIVYIGVGVLVVLFIAATIQVILGSLPLITGTRAASPIVSIIPDPEGVRAGKAVVVHNGKEIEVNSPMKMQAGDSLDYVVANDGTSAQSFRILAATIFQGAFGLFLVACVVLGFWLDRKGIITLS